MAHHVRRSPYHHPRASMRLCAGVEQAIGVLLVISSCSAKVSNFDAAYVVDRVGLEARNKYYEHTHMLYTQGERGKLWEAHVA